MLSCCIRDGQKSTTHIWFKILTGGGGAVVKKRAKMQYLPNDKSEICQSLNQK